MTDTRPLTPKEQKVIQELDNARPGLGELAQKSILNESTGWAEIIADTPESELVVREGFSTNSFMYRRIGG
jgi:hypothetical protein